MSNIIGNDPLLDNVRKQIASAAKNDFCVLIRGESGTGKDIAAREIYEQSNHEGNFVPINISEYPESLLDAELFGHERGAFTGANFRRIGKFEFADKGTLFIDEIADIPLHLQTKLLRTLDSHTITRLGGNTPIKTKFRLICATNKNLNAMMKLGTFREDLFYRINVLPINMPPLRSMPNTIVPMALQIANRTRSEVEKCNVTITNSAAEKLKSYKWPGNFRELINVIQRAVAEIGDMTVIDDDDISVNGLYIQSRGINYCEDLIEVLSPNFRRIAEENPTNLYSIVEDFEEAVIRLAVRETRGNEVKASRLLGISRNTLRNRLHKTKKWEAD